MSASLPASSRMPPAPPGPIVWARQNLFSNWFNSLLTLLSLALILWAGGGFLRWAVFQADWRPVVSSPMLYLVGQYPRQELWRIGACLALASALLGASWKLWGRAMRPFALSYAGMLLIVALWPAPSESLTSTARFFLLANPLLIALGYLLARPLRLKPAALLVLWGLSLPLTLFLLHGSPGLAWLALVPSGQWGGLLVTLLLSVGGILLSFPIGILLALGRRSSLPVVRLFSTLYIEVVRGVPLIGVLFLSSLILPLFLPPEVRIDRLLRALVGMTLFTAAYMAENVRGGLAAIPVGQTAAAQALGLNNFQITVLIVLPQALRAVIPPIVGQFITLFKDTTLASGIAVLELLSVGRSILQGNPEYFGLQMEVFLFIAAVFWVFSYLMSYASLRLEKTLGVGER